MRAHFRPLLVLFSTLISAASAMNFDARDALAYPSSNPQLVWVEGFMPSMLFRKPGIPNVSFSAMEKRVFHPSFSTVFMRNIREMTSGTIAPQFQQRQAKRAIEARQTSTSTGSPMNFDSATWNQEVA